MSNEPEKLDDVERAHITRVWLNNAQNVSKCSRILGIDRRTLYRKLKAYGLYEPSPTCPTCGAERG